jgi:hypothetical protein
MDELESRSPLYIAATEALVSESSANSTFEKMIAVAYSHATLTTFKEELRNIEDLIRKEYEVTSMPNPWRSAKSVISKAMKKNLSLVDDNGGFYGKTKLQTLIKEQEQEDKDPPTTEDYTMSIIKKLVTIPEGIHATTVYSTIQEWLDKNWKP